jgi:multiple sugar transport system ATP-binding protein
MVAGIRPQDVALALSPVQGALEGEVQMVQLLGPEKMVEVSCARRMLSVIVDADLAIGMGQRAWLTFDPTRLHLFDAKTEMNVLPTPAR